MTDNEIIKALENEIRSAEYVDSEYCDGVDLTLIKSAIDLTSRQNAEIERLQKEVNLVSIQFQDMQERYEESQAEIERLKECPKCIYEYDGETTEYCIQGPCSNFKTVEQIKSEAYKSFAECLKEEWFNNYYDSPDVDFDEFVDNLLKEMVGED